MKPPKKRNPIARVITRVTNPKVIPPKKGNKKPHKREQIELED